VRVLVQDDATQQIGSVSQMVDVPDIVSGRLALTGLIIAGRDPRSPVTNAQSTNVDELGEPPPLRGLEDPRPAVRRFKAGMEIDYALLVLNNQLDPVTQKARLRSQVMIYRDGKVVYTGSERSLEPAADNGSQRLVVSGQINLGALLVPGEYVLQVVVTDSLVTDKSYQRVSRWMDFDVVE